MWLFCVPLASLLCSCLATQKEAELVRRERPSQGTAHHTTALTEHKSLNEATQQISGQAATMSARHVPKGLHGLGLHKHARDQRHHHVMEVTPAGGVELLQAAAIELQGVAFPLLDDFQGKWAVPDEDLDVSLLSSAATTLTPQATDTAATLPPSVGIPATLPPAGGTTPAIVAPSITTTPALANAAPGATLTTFAPEDTLAVDPSQQQSAYSSGLPMRQIVFCIVVVVALGALFGFRLSQMRRQEAHYRSRHTAATGGGDAMEPEPSMSWNDPSGPHGRLAGIKADASSASDRPEKATSALDGRGDAVEDEKAMGAVFSRRRKTRDRSSRQGGGESSLGAPSSAKSLRPSGAKAKAASQAAREAPSSSSTSDNVTESNEAARQALQLPARMLDGGVEQKKPSSRGAARLSPRAPQASTLVRSSSDSSDVQL